MVIILVVLIYTWEIHVPLDLIQKRRLKRYGYLSNFVLITPSSGVIIDITEFRVKLLNRKFPLVMVLYSQVTFEMSSQKEEGDYVDMSGLVFINFLHILLK